MTQRSSPIHQTQKLRERGPGDMPGTCKRIVIRQAGGPEVLELVETSTPEPEPGQARVRILVAGVTFNDIMHRKGVLSPRMPYTPGFDIVGVVDKLGEDVTGLEVGQTVAALMPTLGVGGYADFACLDATDLVPVPDSVDQAEAVCLVLNYVAAWQMLKRLAKANDGHKVLVHGAAGGVGTALLDIARHIGCTTYGTCTGGKADVVSEYGATPIDYRSEDVVDRVRSLSGDGVDIVLDPIGGEHWNQSLRALRLEGHLICYGVMDAVRAGRSPDGLAAWFRWFKLKAFKGDKSISVYRVAEENSSRDECRDDLRTLMGLLEQKKLHPLIARRVPLNKAAFAHGLVENAEVAGKVVLLCNV